MQSTIDEKPSGFIWYSISNQCPREFRPVQEDNTLTINKLLALGPIYFIYSTFLMCEEANGAFTFSNNLLLLSGAQSEITGMQ